MNISQQHRYMWSAAVLTSLRLSLDEHGFIEILPAILSERYEPGARHTVAVLGNRELPTVTSTQTPNGEKVAVVSGASHYYLPVSHCVEKQLALEFTERVYCVVPCVRLLMEGEDISGRHLCTFFQVEIELRTESVDEVLVNAEAVLSRFANLLLARLDSSDLLSDNARERIDALAHVPYQRLRFADARRQVAGTGGDANPHAAGDLTRAEEQLLVDAASEPFWLVEYPEDARDSLYRRGPLGTFSTYDLMLPFGVGELSTGGLRPDSADDIRAQAAKFSDCPHPFYADWKARTGVQTGGLGFGLERLIRYCSGVSSVLDLRLAHDQGPNASIGV